MQLLMVQRADGGLTIGDTHVYDEPFDFAVDESPYDRSSSGRRPSWAGICRPWSVDGPGSTPRHRRSHLPSPSIEPAVWVVTGTAAGA